ncbi:MAG TPA: ATP-binding protein [Limnochordia bacterium]|jgi:two-component system phosphate regulon sensor histidine kinase PhoR|nr:ATP-binding protein [Limnochordia bacterium]HPZ31875.1 ATP-binding protein [Limnochordia bacterium]HQD71666.1 ATP-binding protein [Limnochordia bacterium]
MKQTILQNMIILTVIAVLASAVFTTAAVYTVFNNKLREELENSADFVTDLLEAGYDLEELLRSDAVANSATRITLIAEDGEVLFDNHADIREMENHLHREEVQEALEEGSSQTVRRSRTIGTRTLYYAVRLNSGQILRFAVTTESIVYTLYRLLTLIGIMLVAVITATFLLGEKMAEGIIYPLNNLDLDNPLNNEVYGEITPLLTRIHRQNLAIEQQIQQLQAQQDDFIALTNNMAEGLIVVDKTGRIVMVNISALNLFGESNNSNTSFIGKNLLVLSRDIHLNQAVEEALKGEKAEDVITVNEKSYQVFADPIFEGSAVRGALVLLIDISSKYAVEQMRKEFAGNVSHELKTPLTAISSYAELIKDGIARPEDIPEFAAHIYAETQRMIALVDDILKLSRLDEKVDLGPTQSINLLALAGQAEQALRPLADNRQVEVKVSGRPLTVAGNEAILFEMVYNLIDNAIKYSNTGGHVDVKVLEQDGAVLLQVADQGIGIPKQHQGRVFERFYRVDKSHSKKTGGTGLGLSIVKHAALYHNAEVSLESEENKGTTVTVKFNV